MQRKFDRVNYTGELSFRHCSMVIFKNNKIYKEVTKRFWTFFHNIDCQNKEDFYLDQTWRWASGIKFASICKSKCTNINAHTKTTTTHSTPWTRTPAQDGSDSSGYEDDTEQPETEE